MWNREYDIRACLLSNALYSMDKTDISLTKAHLISFHSNLCNKFDDDQPPFQFSVVIQIGDESA